MFTTINSWCETVLHRTISKCDLERALVLYFDGDSILDKVRAEIENDWQLKEYPNSPFSCGLRRAIEIIDKYEAESEVKA